MSLPGGGAATVIATTGATFTLSAPWTGPGGKQPVSFRSDQHNYLVHFTLPIP